MERLNNPAYTHLRGKALLAAVMCFAASAAQATKLDLSSTIDIKASNYQHMIYGAERNSQGVYSENATLGFIIKDIRLEKTPNSTMDVGVVLRSAGVGAASDTVRAPQFQDGINRLPQATGTPFVKEAYVRIYHFVRRNYTAVFGRQSFTLGQGITLSDDGLGMPGARVEADKLFGRTLKAEVFFFRPQKDAVDYGIYGGSLYYPSNEGLWHVYHFWEQDQGTGTEPLYNTLTRVKKFTGVRYFLSYGQLDFDGEFIVQRGRATTSTRPVKYEGSAFLLKGAWNQGLGFLGMSRMRLAYGRASGNSGAPTSKDKAFYPTFGRRYDGIERSGFGAIAGATLYDTIKTSATPNGMPYGTSGLNVINIGADIPFKKLVISADMYRFKASGNIAGDDLQIGRETDLKATYKLGSGLQLSLVYAVFKPLSLYTLTTPVKLVSTALSARF